MEQTADKLAEMLALVKTDNPIASALAEDEAVREQSRRRSAAYLEMVEKEKNDIPEWMWGVLWFILGAFFWESVPAIVAIIDTICQSQGINLKEALPVLPWLR